MNSLKISIFIFLFILFTGCSKNISTPNEVYIPVKCKITLPERPIQSSSYLEDILNILAYTEKLEKVIERCVEN